MRLDREDAVEHIIKISEAEAEEMWDELYRTATPADHPRLYDLYILLCERNLDSDSHVTRI